MKGAQPVKRILFITMLFIAASSSALVWSANRRAGSLEDALVAQEKQIIESLKKRDSASFKNLVATDALLVGSQGTIEASEATSQMFSPDYALVSATIEEPQAKMIDKDAAMLIYKTTGTESYKGKSHTETAYASTLYVKRGDKWVAMFHQESTMTKPAQETAQHK